MVGRIVNNDEKCHVSRGQEKGRFEFGGSTVILAFAKDMVKIKDEIIKNSAEDFETNCKDGGCYRREILTLSGKYTIVLCASSKADC